MKIFKISSANVDLYIKTNLGGDFFDDIFFDAYIPSCLFLGEVKKIYKNNFVVTILESDQVGLRKTGPFRFNFTYNKQTSNRDIISVIEYVLEYVRNLSTVYCVHSSTVLIKGNLFVFWGCATGVGKTRTAKVLAKKLGGTFVSDEKGLFCLKEKRFLGGVSKMYTHRTVNEKYSLNNEFIDLGTSTSKLQNIRTMCFVYIHNLGSKAKESAAFPFSEKEFGWHLYEDLTRKIRGTSRRVNNSSIPLMSLDTESLSKKRVEDVRKFCKKIKCYYVRSDEGAIISFIKSNL